VEGPEVAGVHVAVEVEDRVAGAAECTAERAEVAGR
jgi:hypothetical protein